MARSLDRDGRVARWRSDNSPTALSVEQKEDWNIRNFDIAFFHLLFVFRLLCSGIQRPSRGSGEVSGLRSTPLNQERFGGFSKLFLSLPIYHLLINYSSFLGTGTLAAQLGQVA